MPTYKIHEGSLQERFHASRAKIRLYGGGFANGKTAAGCVLALNLAKDYPGSNGLIARATYPKLNDTIRKEFMKWCPEHWIKSFPRSQNASNTCTLTNGTTINFRYIAQQGKEGNEATTSNLLSATYDWIVVDQMEDPEIVHKDFLDLLGRLRGSAKYAGNDITMPSTGPRWFVMTTKPTRNWVYKRIVEPIHKFNKGQVVDDLICERDEHGRVVLKDGKPTPLVELFEGSTYENKENLEPDFIRTLESTYTGQMRDRFLLGKWSAYEGLVYSEFGTDTNVIEHYKVVDYLKRLQSTHRDIAYLEGFDHGIAVPSCYLFGFADGDSNVFIIDGFHKKEMSVEETASRIKDIRKKYNTDTNKVWGDPDIFRRKGGEKKTVGKAVSALLHSEGIYCVRGNNDVRNGIIKCKQYLNVQMLHKHPITGVMGAPYLFISDGLDFFITEIVDYYWKKDAKGDVLDEPNGKNDHAMDTMKYMLSDRPSIATVISFPTPKSLGLLSWAESEVQERVKAHRYG